MISLIKKVFDWYFKTYMEVYGPIIELGVNPFM